MLIDKLTDLATRCDMEAPHFTLQRECAMALREAAKALTTKPAPYEDTGIAAALYASKGHD